MCNNPKQINISSKKKLLLKKKKNFIPKLCEIKSKFSCIIKYITPKAKVKSLTEKVRRYRRFLILNKWNHLTNAQSKKKPKVSEASQFHQPPQVPSWRAHQLPKYNATNVTHTPTLTWFKTLYSLVLLDQTIRAVWVDLDNVKHRLNNKETPT